MRYNQKKKVLVMTSSFPTSRKDVKNFVYNLSNKLAHDCKIFILAPFIKNVKSYERWNKIVIYRYHISPIGDCGMVYGDGILQNIRKKPYLIFLLPFMFINNILALHRVIKKENISIIHAHWIFPQGAVATCYKFLGITNIKVVLTIHGSDMLSINKCFINYIRRVILSNSDYITVVSNYLKKRAKLLCSNCKIYVYPMGVDTNTFSPIKKSAEFRKRFGVNNILILYVGWLIKEKGVETLLDVFVKINKILSNTRLIVVGEGNMKKKLKHIVNINRLENKVFFEGMVAHKNLPKYYASSDILLFPSFKEGLGMVVLEGMSSGTLVVSSDYPAVHDMVKSYYSGILFERGNSNDACKKIIDILSRNDKITKIKENARNVVVKKFDINITTYKYKKLFMNI